MIALANWGCEELCKGKNSKSVEFCFLHPVTVTSDYCILCNSAKKINKSINKIKTFFLLKIVTDDVTSGSFVKLEMEGQKLTAHVVVYTTHFSKYSRSSMYSMYSSNYLYYKYGYLISYNVFTAGSSTQISGMFHHYLLV